MKKEFLAIIMLAMLFACKSEDDPVLTSIKLDKTELTLKVGEEYAFKVIKNPETAPTPTYNWIVNDMGANKVIGTIDNKGVFKALNVGQVNISVDVINSNMLPITAHCLVTVEPIKAEGLKLDQTELYLKAGESKTLTCSFIPEDTTDKELIWKSSDEKIATVTPEETSNKAKITTVGAGEAIITAYLKNDTKVSAQCKINIDPAKLENLTLKEKEKEVIQGESFTLTPVFIPEYATNKNITWSSSDEEIAKVDNNGNVTTINWGDCIIKATAEDGGFEAICKLAVKPLPVESIAFSNYSYKVEIGGERQLNVKFTPENAGNKKIKWSTSNSIIAPIDENGLVKGNSTGWATITAESEDGGHKASCQIQVAEIDQFVDLYFPSASVIVLNGYTTGTIYSGIRNNSSKTITLTKFYIVDSGTWKTVAETSDASMLGNLAPGQSTNLGGRINNVYEPIYVWEFSYNGVDYHIQKQYGKDNPYSAKIETKGYSNAMINLSKSR